MLCEVQGVEKWADVQGLRAINKEKTCTADGSRDSRVTASSVLEWMKQLLKFATSVNSTASPKGGPAQQKAAVAMDDSTNSRAAAASVHF